MGVNIAEVVTKALEPAGKAMKKLIAIRKEVDKAIERRKTKGAV